MKDIISFNIKPIHVFLVMLLYCTKVTAQKSDSLIYADEKHFKGIKQLTFNGDNAEAYWSYDDRHIIF